MKNLNPLVLLFVLFSCSNDSNNESDQKKKIDSLNNIVKLQDDSIKKLKETKNAQERNNVTARYEILNKVYPDKPTFIPVSFGGFKNIRFNLFNDSKYNLDQVIVNVHYIKANGSEINTATKIISNVEPNSHRALSAPDYLAAGTSLYATIESMHCKSIDLCYFLSTADTITSRDPYKCK